MRNKWLLEITPANQIEAEVTKRGNGCRIKLAGNIASKQIRQSAKGNRLPLFSSRIRPAVLKPLHFRNIGSRQTILDHDGPMMVKADARMEEGGVRLLIVE